MRETESGLPFLIGGGMFLVVIFLAMGDAYRAEKGYQINGIVNEVAFGKKGTPEITIGYKLYFITFPDNAFAKKIQVGDSIAKEKGSRVYKLIKKNSREEILSE